MAARHPPGALQFSGADMTSRGLQALFESFNRQFFAGQLPAYRVYSRAKVVGDGIELPGCCDSTNRVILIQRGIAGDALRRLLLHEMCHIGTPYHGRKFQAKLLQLAAQGEAWAGEEASGLADGYSWNQAVRGLCDQLDETARFSPRPRFPAAVRALARSLRPGLNPNELLRMAPWLRARWKKACTAADKEAALRKRYGVVRS